MSDDDHPQLSSRVGVINAALKGPSGFLVVGVLVVEAILGGLALRASGHDFTVLIYGMLGVFVLLVVVFFILLLVRPDLFAPRSPNGDWFPPLPDYVYDVFVSAPMAATHSEQEYVTIRREVLDVVECLRTACGFQQVYFAGENIAKKSDFDSEALAVKDDFERLQKSRYFLLVFMHPAMSSALVEAGVALAAGMPSVYLVRKTEELPFLLRNANQAFDNVKTYECTDVRRAKALLNRSKERLFIG